MTYEFGDYKLVTCKTRFFFAFYDYKGSLYYKDYKLNSIDRWSEDSLLYWATGEIRAHKNALKAAAFAADA